MNRNRATFALPRARPNRRGGFVYFFILSTALFVSAIAMAVLIAARTNGRVMVDANDSVKAEELAPSAVELALQAIAADPNWRSDYPNNFPVGPLALGEGTISFTIVDDVDGNLTNNNYDSIRIYGVGQVRGARRIYSVRCTTRTALDCLKTAGAFGGAVTLSNMTLDGTSALLLCSNSAISANAVNFAAPVTLESPSANTITLTAYTGSSPAIAPGARQLPDPAHVFDYYLTQATPIAIGNLPIVNGTSLMQLAVLSPASNPYGIATNAQGIYVIDCHGQTLQISQMRIVGTLIILNPGPNSATLQSNYLTPALANFPALLVKGDFTLASISTPLADNPNTANPQTPAINYNPPGTPYQGMADTTFTTTYPSRIEGIVYVSGNLTATNSPVINGVLLAGGVFIQIAGALTLGGDAAAVADPPPGFTSEAVVPMSGTWRWETGR